MNVPLRDAATVMVVRDTDAGMEVLMLRRADDAAFVAGACVFPGGAVDPADAETFDVCSGRDDGEASAVLGVERGGLAFWVAGIRECFEEAGVLLAHDHDARLVRFDRPGVRDRFAVHRAELHAGRRRLVELCRAEHLRLAVGGVHYFSHWITPEGVHRRYDTRFFVAQAPEGQEPSPDDRETVAALWVRPGNALEQHRRGQLHLVLPTIRNLRAIAGFETSADLLAAAARVREVPAIVPRAVVDGRGLRFLVPGDEGYDDVVAAGGGAGPVV